MDSTELPQVLARSPRQLGQALARLRGLRGATQVAVAEAAGLRQSTVSSVESGAGGTELATVFALLAALDLEIVVQQRTTGPSSSRLRGGEGG